MFKIRWNHDIFVLVFVRILGLLFLTRVVAVSFHCEKQEHNETLQIKKLKGENFIMSIHITFPDGAVKPFDSGITTFDVAKSISNSLAKSFSW